MVIVNNDYFKVRFGFQAYKQIKTVNNNNIKIRVRGSIEGIH